MTDEEKPNDQGILETIESKEKNICGFPGPGIELGTLISTQPPPPKVYEVLDFFGNASFHSLFLRIRHASVY